MMVVKEVRVVDEVNEANEETRRTRRTKRTRRTGREAGERGRGEKRGRERSGEKDRRLLPRKREGNRIFACLFC